MEEKGAWAYSAHCKKVRFIKDKFVIQKPVTSKITSSTKSQKNGSINCEESNV